MVIKFISKDVWEGIASFLSEGFIVMVQYVRQSLENLILRELSCNFNASQWKISSTSESIFGNIFIFTHDIFNDFGDESIGANGDKLGRVTAFTNKAQGHQSVLLSKLIFLINQVSQIGKGAWGLIIIWVWRSSNKVGNEPSSGSKVQNSFGGGAELSWNSLDNSQVYHLISVWKVFLTCYVW